MRKAGFAKTEPEVAEKCCYSECCVTLNAEVRCVWSCSLCLSLFSCTTLLLSIYDISSALVKRINAALTCQHGSACLMRPTALGVCQSLF